MPAVTDFKVSINYKQILSIAMPIAFAIMVPQINYITNNIFFGRLNEEALAVAGITGVYYLIFAVIGNGLNNGLQSLIARRAGENRIEDIGNLFAQGVRIAMLLSIVGIAITWLIAPIILRYSIHNEVTVNMAISFLRIRIVGLVFLYLYQMRNAVLVGTNQSKYLIIGTATEAIVNIILDYGFIYGKLGLPHLGFNGAAYASVIAEGCGLFSIFLVIHFKGIDKKLMLFKNFNLDKQSFKLILVQSSPLIAQYGISIVTWEFFYILIEHHGSRALAISNTMRNVFGFFGCFTWAFAATANTMVSNIIGQGLSDKVVELIHKIIRLSLMFSITVGIIINIFPAVVLSIYGQDVSFITEAIPILRVVSVAMIIMSAGTVWLNAVTGTGNTKVNLLIELFAIFFYIIYVYIVLEWKNMSIIYGWGSEWLYWICTFIPSYLYIKSNKWRGKKI
ncbi:MAG: MATE family efflux transporter [Bacteroidetes bacterium]|nr:MATE family efflux transporter [Bacteroidota bacterium]MBS1648631.1 MATE family efflux transporter [Bacteroidota bacterium]